ncbi:MAG: 4'-phosphopantetheinyl transferase superfamily protein [Opitutales bacterium]|nr:4'-phosphopantetheinyl transferase superfamily protein [Opitutales bacterium]
MPSPDLTLTEHIAALLPDGVAVVAGRIEDLQDPLFVSEKSAVARAIPKRVREFTAGRTAARRAMSQLGVSPTALPPLESRAPAWPESIVGAITHTDTLAAAIVGEAKHMRSLGLDLEDTHRLEPKLWGTLFTKNEQRYLTSLPVGEQQRSATLFFSAKEAFFKYQFPLTQAWVGFHDAELHPTSDSTLSLKLLRSDLPALRHPQPTIQYRFGPTWVVTTVHD